MLFLFIIIVGAVLSFFGPWWTIAPVCFVGCWWLARQASGAFWTSASGGAAVWVGYSIYLHISTGAGLAAQVAGIFTGGAPFAAGPAGAVLMVAISALVAALVSGFAGLAGLRIKQLLT
ncbi:hypothetical protein [Parapedobacter sp. 10938]|uniref:hypothetical protein n=1 Tax=Parapedobacter flavus TaxID=3110225 RepID=UPI002DB5B547|nr:hypothetical protein [Parapedobacter sp. 10938]MEC3880379.1 hypothetical protein [Parapedobacter sp. 10938]